MADSTMSGPRQAAETQRIEAIVALARQGRMDEAALAANRAMAEGLDGPVIHALTGTIEFHRRRYGPAADYLERAHAAKPEDPVVRRHLVETSHHLQRWDRVLMLVDPGWVRTDPSLQLARIAGHAAQALARPAEAVTYYRMVVDADPRDWASWNNLGNALAALALPDEAEEALRRSLHLAPDARPTLLNLANVLLSAGKHAEADAVLTQMIRTDPQDAHPHYSRFQLLFELRREEEAQEELHTAARLAPERADIQTDLGQHALRIGLLDRAHDAFRASLALDPGNAAAYVGLAFALDLLNREQDLPALKQQADAAAIDAPSRAVIDALRDRRLGRDAQALETLEIARPALTPAQYIQQRGALLDRLGRSAEAFASFEELNALTLADPSAPRKRAASYRAAIARSNALLTPTWLEGWTPPIPQDRPAPVFLLGFPRSGTTLLDTMLLSDPHVRVLEERPFIADLETELGGIEALPTLDADTIRAARARYFDRAAQLADIGESTVLIDKHPMHLVSVLTIRRLFPEARFVLALRHPCDVLLSCFMTGFSINDAMANFLDLGDAAALYDLAFTHWQQTRDLCGLAVSTVVYEDLVRDPEGQLRPVFADLGLDWPKQGVDHRDAARRRGAVPTASYAQVTEALYSRAAGRWVRYAAQLAPVLERLRPWAERFGYPLEVG